MATVPWLAPCLHLWGRSVTEHVRGGFAPLSTPTPRNCAADKLRLTVPTFPEREPLQHVSVLALSLGFRDTRPALRSKSEVQDPSPTLHADGESKHPKHPLYTTKEP